MKSLEKTMMAILLLLSVMVSNAQIKNAKTETVKIYGNCAMCKTTIEKAGNLKNIANVNWNVDTKNAILTYDPKLTNQDEILKRIALAGYDSDKFLAPDTVYSKLTECCQYIREAKTPVKKALGTEMAGMKISNNSSMMESQDANQLQAVFDNYFLLKDALVNTDSKSASEKATVLLFTITAVKMEKLKMDEHTVWMQILKNLTVDVKSISETQDIEKQRNVFDSLSKNVYELIKVSKPTEAVYYQYCPMKKMNWLSKENTIKNPYFGTQMLSCGSVVETIK
jgi:copper chaperone CopZ